MTLMCNVLVSVRVLAGGGGGFNAFTVPPCDCVLMQYVVTHTYMHVHLCIFLNSRGHFKDKGCSLTH